MNNIVCVCQVLVQWENLNFSYYFWNIWYHGFFMFSRATTKCTVVTAGQALSRRNRYSYNGPRACRGPTPWRLCRLFILSDTPCARKFSRIGLQISLLTNNAPVSTNDLFHLLSNVIKRAKYSRAGLYVCALLSMSPSLWMELAC